MGTLVELLGSKVAPFKGRVLAAHEICAQGIHAGGPGSGCHGDSCGRPSGGGKSGGGPGTGHKGTSSVSKALDKVRLKRMQDVAKKHGYKPDGKVGDEYHYEHKSGKAGLTITEPSHGKPGPNWHHSDDNSDGHGSQKITPGRNARALDDHLSKFHQPTWTPTVSDRETLGRVPIKQRGDR